MPKKPRSDSKLASLPQAQRERLDFWLVEENHSVADIRQLILDEFGVETSVGAISGYFKKHCALKRVGYARKLADSLGDLETSGDYERLALANLQQQFFEMALSPDVDVDDLNTLGRIIGESHKLRLKARQIELAERRVTLLEEKAAKFDQAGDTMASQLTDEEKAQRLREIFNIA